MLLEDTAVASEAIIMGKNREASVLELARSISEGTTAGKPDWEAVLVDIDRLTTSWKTKSVLVSEHALNATQCLLAASNRNSAGSDEGGESSVDGTLFSSLSAAATRCVDQECLAIKHQETARVLRESMRSELAAADAEADDLGSEFFVNIWQRHYSSAGAGVNRGRNTLTTERNCEKVRCLVEGGSVEHENVDDFTSSPQTCAVEPELDPISGDASRSVSLGHNWQQDTSRIRCPVTGVLMQEPVRNRECMHSYEKQGIEQLIRSHNRLRLRENLSNNHEAPCPVAGCTSMVSIASLEPDTEMMLSMERMRRREARLKNRRAAVNAPKESGSMDPIEDATP